jgi:hypothetical protein
MEEGRDLSFGLVQSSRNMLFLFFAKGERGGREKERERERERERGGRGRERG